LATDDTPEWGAAGSARHPVLPLVAAPGFGDAARALAASRAFDYGGEREHLRDEAVPLVLWLDGAGLSVRQTGPRAMGPVRCDFAGGEVRHRRLYGGGKSQAIAKAVGARDKLRPRVVDLTAGLGGDAFALAGIGCRVTIVERHPVVAALLDDGLRRAASVATEDMELGAVLARLTLVQAEAADWLRHCPEELRPDVIYLDPMFPERRKSAQVNKAMQVFHDLVGSDGDADRLLPLALAAARFRVVVKRPSHAPWLDGREPGLSLKGKSVRFDVYALKRMV